MIDKQALRAAFSRDFAARSLTVAAVVGTILNLINQGHALTGGADFRPWTAALTYCVPFFVSTYGAYAGLARSAPIIQNDASREET